MSKKTKPVFLGGYMHSGTTLLFDLLSTDSEIYTGIKETKVLEFSSNFINKDSYFMLNAITCEKNNKHKIKEGTVTKENFFKTYFEIFTKLSQFKNQFFFLDGSPNNYLFFKELYKFNQQSKLIFIERCPLDILSSIKKRKLLLKTDFYKNKKKKKKLEKKYYLFIHALSIYSCIQKSKYLKRKYNENVLIITYEDLCLKTNYTLQLVSDFLNKKNNINLEDKRLTNNFSKKINNNSSKIIYTTHYKENLNGFEIFVAKFIFKMNINFRDFLSFKFLILFFPYFLFELLKTLYGFTDFFISRSRQLSSKEFVNYLLLRIKRIF